MGKLLCDSSATVQSSSALQPWRDPLLDSPSQEEEDPPSSGSDFETLTGLEDEQKRSLQKLCTKGVLWKHPTNQSSSLFLLFHGGDVQADGNCLFSASKAAMEVRVEPNELRKRTVVRFLQDYESEGLHRGFIDGAIRNMYSPDLLAGWGVHLVQEVKLLARKDQREGLDAAISELVALGLQRETAAEIIYKERCITVVDGPSWATYMSVSGSPDDEHDIITLQYTEEGLLYVDENRDGRSAAFGDDIAIESLATEFNREIYVVQSHGSDAMIDDENCIFFLPHHPRGQISEPPFFLFMKGRGWCGAGADHYEPLIAHSAPILSQEKGAFVL
ncbi:hypothetical protein AMTRI_Chr06g171270 [Amborella trichopoda]